VLYGGERPSILSRRRSMPGHSMPAHTQRHMQYTYGICRTVHKALSRVGTVLHGGGEAQHLEQTDVDARAQHACSRHHTDKLYEPPAVLLVIHNTVLLVLHTLCSASSDKGEIGAEPQQMPPQSHRAIKKGWEQGSDRRWRR